MTMLKVESMTTGYEKKTVINDLSFEVMQGEFLGIIGPNGSGKSTLIKAMTRYLPLWKGRILLDGRDISAQSQSDFSRRVAVVSQHAPSALQMPAKDFVMLGRMPYRRRWQLWEAEEDVRHVDEAMALAGVSHLAHRLMDALSGGERQSVVIARALAQQPDLLLLDEPTTHLDISHQLDLLDLLRRLNRQQGLTILTVLHDLNLAGEYCDRLLLLHEGRRYQAGPPHEVLTYETIEAVYNTVVIVGQNPVSSKPVVYPVPADLRTL